MNEITTTFVIWLSVLLLSHSSFSQNSSNDKKHISEVKVTDDSLQSNYRQRLVLDKQKYSKKIINKIERYYIASIKKPNTIEARRKINLLVSRYSDSNRAGCALLNLALWEKGHRKEHLLIHAFEKHPTCYYQNGTNVASYALFLLIQHYENEGQMDKAKQLKKMLLANFPHAIDPKGRLLVKQIDPKP